VSEDKPDDLVLEVRADLDLPGETARQTKIFLTWFCCLVLAVIVSSIAASRAEGDGGSALHDDSTLTAKRAARVRVGLPIALLLPAVLTWIIHHRHRRGGGHARGIYVDVTTGGELRIWGRSYGSRVALDSAEISERLVDVYTGRLGAWRQRRLKVRANLPARGAIVEIELSTCAVESDMDLGLRVEGGEGDCVELEREGFLRVRDAVFAAAAAASRRALESNEGADVSAASHAGTPSEA